MVAIKTKQNAFLKPTKEHPHQITFKRRHSQLTPRGWSMTHHNPPTCLSTNFILFHPSRATLYIYHQLILQTDFQCANIGEYTFKRQMMTHVCVWEHRRIAICDCWMEDAVCLYVCVCVTQRTAFRETKSRCKRDYIFRDIARKLLTTSFGWVGWCARERW